jgi:hypothetical protein
MPFMETAVPSNEEEKKYAALGEALPDIPIDPQRWGPRAVDMFLSMVKTGPLFKQSAAEIIRRDIPVHAVTESKGVGASWHENLAGERWITFDKELDEDFQLVAVAHEAYHLGQPIRLRCSVEGEFYAWRFGYKLMEELAARSVFFPMSEDDRLLAALPGPPSREDLKTAQTLMRRIGGPGYRIHLAPLRGTDWPAGFYAIAAKIINCFVERGQKL